MTKNFLEIGLDWEGPGFFAAPFTPSDAATQREREREPWLAWQERFTEAKQGRFDRLTDLVAIYEGGYDWVLSGACTDLLGDAGTDACLRLMVERMVSAPDPIRALMMRVDFSVALTMAGKLGYLPTIVDAYQKIHTSDDADIIPYAISDMLEPDLGPLSDPSEFNTIDEYGEAVLARGDELEKRYGSATAVFAGEPYSVIRIAHTALDALAAGTFDNGLRQRFEATTGISATGFYSGKALQALTAAATIETFLNSPDAGRFREGVRYFFGHSIP